MEGPKGGQSGDSLLGHLHQKDPALHSLRPKVPGDHQSAGTVESEDISAVAVHVWLVLSPLLPHRVLAVLEGGDHHCNSSSSSRSKHHVREVD